MVVVVPRATTQEEALEKAYGQLELQGVELTFLGKHSDQQAVIVFPDAEIQEAYTKERAVGEAMLNLPKGSSVRYLLDDDEKWDVTIAPLEDTTARVAPSVRASTLDEALAKAGRLA
jgi:hypothetical protein